MSIKDRPKYTPPKIERLEHDEIVVFGSNDSGKHVGGLARECERKWGAVGGVSMGSAGQTYAIETVCEKKETLTKREYDNSIYNYIEWQVKQLNKFARNNPEKTIYMTKIGCGIAKLEEREIIKALDIMGLEPNILLPEEWERRRYVYFYEKTGRTKEYCIEDRKMHRVYYFENKRSGGLIENRWNLDQTSNAYVFDEAMVFGEANVELGSLVDGNAVVCGGVIENSRISDNAVVSDCEAISNSRIEDDSRIDGSGVCINKSNICEEAHIGGAVEVVNSTVKGKGKATEKQYIYNSELSLNIDDNKNKVHSISCQLGQLPDENGDYIFAKFVWKESKGVFHSDYNEDFQYFTGEVAVVDYPEMSTESCADGLHVSRIGYWDTGDTHILVRVNIGDIITCQHGKVRCKKLFVIGQIDDRTLMV